MGFISFESSVQKACEYIITKQSILHTDQDESLYQYVKIFVENYYEKARTEINQVLARLDYFYRAVMAKQDGYNVRFSNLGVSIQNVVDSIQVSLKNITFHSIIDETTGELLIDIFNRDGAEAQKTAKNFLINEITEIIKNNKLGINEKVRVDNETCVNECVNEMNTMYDSIAKLSYIPSENLEQLRFECNKREDLEKIIERYDTKSKKLIEEVLKLVPSIIQSYQYEMGISVKTKDLISDVLDRCKIEIDRQGEKIENEDDDETENTEESQRRHKIMEELSSKNVANLQDKFQNDIEQLIFHCQYSCVEAAHEIAQVVKKDIDEFTKNILKTYFGSILEKIEVISTSVNSLLEEYSLE